MTCPVGHLAQARACRPVRLRQVAANGTQDRVTIRFALAFLLLPVAAIGQPAACPQFFPGGQPPALVNPKLRPRTTALCNDGYAVLASGITRGALWSAEHLTAANVGAARETPREGEFHPEARLPAADRAELEDYRRSGYDRGHMTPSGDMPDEAAQQQTFSLANMVPQAGELNRGVWAEIESTVRDLARQNNELFVVTGPVFAGAVVTAIGPHGVLVPSATWKAVFDPRSRRSGAYLCTNVDAPQCRVVPVAELARTAGVDPFPAVPAASKRAAVALPLPDTAAHGGARRRPAPQD